MRVALAFGSFVLFWATFITGIWGAAASDPHMFMAAVILFIAFAVVGFHAAEIDHKERKK
jgi:hypothetical protein